MKCTVTIECDERHVSAVRNALDLADRLALGQFGELADLHAAEAGKKTGKARWELRDAVDRALKPILTPDMPSLGSSYGVGNAVLSEQSKLWYELWKAFGGGTDGPALNFSGIAPPVVKIERHPEGTR